MFLTALWRRVTRRRPSSPPARPVTLGYTAEERKRQAAELRRGFGFRS